MVKRITKIILLIPCIILAFIQVVFWVCVWVITGRSFIEGRKDAIEYLQEW